MIAEWRQHTVSGWRTVVVFVPSIPCQPCRRECTIEDR